ncbi:hypothetical protein [Magnetospirillum sulfuroxidans]|uniref:Phage integrase family protein n=1 Tax=Magnetospirillum sulfuroxidans TaxID=611300 RepID=A0ABS5IAX1_9PROT|nr:hypothetical protein [Magnetospirillum sulfuroxidans]MBR9971535.1 hypothetical protein [Magnetospirillum sulfuroxidans]
MPRLAARKVITAAMVDRLKPAPKGSRTEHWDAMVPGFGLRVTDAGGKWTAWEIPSMRTKNSRPHVVPLSPLAAKIIAGRPEIGEAGLLFSATGTTPASGFSRAKRRIDKHINEARKKAEQKPMPDWDLHDLRRTMVTMMNEKLGIAPDLPWEISSSLK